MNATTQAVIKSFEQYVSQIERYPGIKQALKDELDGFTHALMFCGDLDPTTYKELLKKAKEIRNS